MGASLEDHYSAYHRHYSQQLRVTYIIRVLFHMQTEENKFCQRFVISQEANCLSSATAFSVNLALSPDSSSTTFATQ